MQHGLSITRRHVAEACWSRRLEACFTNGLFVSFEDYNILCTWSTTMDLPPSHDSGKRKWSTSMYYFGFGITWLAHIQAWNLFFRPIAPCRYWGSLSILVTWVFSALGNVYRIVYCFHRAGRLWQKKLKSVWDSDRYTWYYVVATKHICTLIRGARFVMGCALNHAICRRIVLQLAGVSCCQLL